MPECPDCPGRDHLAGVEGREPSPCEHGHVLRDQAGDGWECLDCDHKESGRQTTACRPPHACEADETCDAHAGREPTPDKWQAGLDGLHTNDCWDDDHSGCREIVDAVIDGIENAGYRIAPKEDDRG